MDVAIHHGSHDAGGQFYLKYTVHYAMAGNPIKIDDGAVRLGIWDPRCGTEARGIL